MPSTRVRITALITGVLLAWSGSAAYAAWTRASTAQHAKAKYGTWVTCTAGSTAAVNPSTDTWIQSNLPNANHGNESTFQVGHPSAGQEYRALLKFPTPTIPSGCTVSKTEIRLTATNQCTAARNINMYPIDTAWGETTVTYANRPGTFGDSLLAATSMTGCSDGVTKLWSFVGSGNYAWSNGIEFADSNTAGSNVLQTFSSRTAATNPPKPTMVVFYS